MTAWFFGNLVWASAAMLLVLAIRRPVAHLLGAGIAYALWLIPALRLVAPPAEWLASVIPGAMPSLPPLLLFVEEPGAAEALSGDESGGWLTAVILLWAAGALLFLVSQFFLYRRFLARLSLSMRSAGSHDGVPLIESGAVDGPLALGLIDRRIVVPAGFEKRYSPEERRLALEHERHHHRRGDIFANHIALLVLALNWFNPIGWLSFRAFRADQELSCDAAIAASAGPEQRSDYARALVKSASGHSLIAACPLNRADQLKRRLKMLNRHRKDRRRLAAGTALTVSLVAASLAFGSPGHAQDKAEPKQERRQVIILEQRGTGDADAAPRVRERREFVLRRDGDGNITTNGLDPELEARIRECRENNSLVNVEEGEGNQRTRVVLCTRGEGSAANNVEALERARERIAGQDELSAETRARILAQLDQAIARARAGN